MAQPIVKVTVTGVKKTQQKIARAGQVGKSALGMALFVEGEKIMGASKLLVPVVTGNLRASGHVQLPQIAAGVVFVDLGYGGSAAPYAVKVHENPRAGKTGGVSPRGIPYPVSKSGKPTWSHHPLGQWKYLEQPFKAAIPGLQQRIKSFVSARLRLGR